MSKRNNPSSAGTGTVKSADEVSHAASHTVAHDFWGNMIFFLLVTIAICFVLANNTPGMLLSTTGIVVLSILLLLDLLAIIPLIRLLNAVVSLRLKRESK
ncbi:hypothetical protein ACFL5K_00975 [Gemmatimonadota bacterium]